VTSAISGGGSNGGGGGTGGAWGKNLKNNMGGQANINVNLPFFDRLREQELEQLAAEIEERRRSSDATERRDTIDETTAGVSNETKKTNAEENKSITNGECKEPLERRLDSLHDSEHLSVAHQLDEGVFTDDSGSAFLKGQVSFEDGHHIADGPPTNEAENGVCRAATYVEKSKTDYCLDAVAKKGLQNTQRFDTRSDTTVFMNGAGLGERFPLEDCGNYGGGLKSVKEEVRHCYEDAMEDVLNETFTKDRFGCCCLCFSSVFVFTISFSFLLLPRMIYFFDLA